LLSYRSSYRMPPKANHRRRRPPGAATARYGGNASGASGASRPASKFEVVSTPGATEVSSTSRAEHLTVDSTALCPVCASVSVNLAVGTCGHAVCAPCSHRLRFLYKRRTCVLCNVVNDQVAVIPATAYVPGETTAESIRTSRANSECTNLLHDVATDMFFVDASVMARLQLIAGLTCPVYVSGMLAQDSQEISTLNNDRKVEESGKNYSVEDVNCRAPSHRNPGALRAHVREQHRALYCDVCFESKKEYLSMMSTYPMDTPGGKQLAVRDHMNSEHPRCKFCNVHLLGDDELFAHLQTNHEACRICEREGRLHQYFRNYSALEVHFRAHHHVCEDQNCRGVVFASNIELQAHILQQHRADLPRNSRARRLHVDLTELHAPVVPRTRRGDQSFAPRLDSEGDIRMEQERQAARRRGFLASNVVYSAEGSASHGRVAPGEVSETQPLSSEVTLADRPPRVSEPQIANAAGTSISSTHGESRDEVERLGDSAAGEPVFYERSPPADPNIGAARNRVLIATIRDALDPAEFEQFRSLSGEFRELRIGSEQYYDAAIEAFGVRRAISDILPELAALLPSTALRNDLVRVCKSRHPIRARDGAVVSETSTVGSNVTGVNSCHPTTPVDSHDAFPSLSRNGLPSRGTAFPTANETLPSRMPVAPPRNDDFPQLGRGARTPDSTSSVSGESRNRVLGPSQRATGRNQRTTAAQVLMQPNLQRVFGNTATGSRAAPERTGPLLPPDAFPSLSVGAVDSGAGTSTATVSANSRSRPISRDMNHRTGPLAEASAFPSLDVRAGVSPAEPTSSLGRIDTRSDSISQSAPDPDVSMRAGAVWGGASGRASQGSRRRGPGRVISIVENTSEPRLEPSAASFASFPAFPSLRDVNGSDSRNSNNNEQMRGKKPTIIDIPILARDKMSKSALPKVGGSGYGFAWDRKKMQAKQREVKTAVGSSSKEGTTRTSSRDDLQSVRPVQHEEGQSDTLGFSVLGSTEEISQDGAAVDIECASGSEANPNVVDGCQDGKSSSESTLDQFAYLAVGSSRRASKDPTASFFDS
jgi:hypothetical protein